MASTTQSFIDGLLTLNATHSGVGYSQGPNSPVEQKQVSTWLATNQTKGVQQRTKNELWKEFISGPKYESQTGQRLTPGNYVTVAKAESQRLFDLGFTMVHDPDVARIIFESYRKAAGSPGMTYFPISEDSAALLTEANEKYDYQYITGNIIDNTISAVPSVIRKAGDKLEDLGDVVTNPLTLPALAVISVAAALIFLRAT